MASRPAPPSPKSRCGRSVDDRRGSGRVVRSSLLARINRELGGSLPLAAFDHRAVYDRVKGRIEIQLVSNRWQWAAVHGQWVNFGAGEAVTAPRGVPPSAP